MNTANAPRTAEGPKDYMLGLRDVMARIESLDYDLESDSISRQHLDNVMVAKSKAIDVQNYMLRHNMSGIVLNAEPRTISSMSDIINYAYISIFGASSNIMEEKQLILMQGVPGSGKSSIATIIANHINAKVVSNNDYMVKNNKYCFEPARLNECIEKCQDAAERYAEEGWNLIIDNVNAEPFTVDYYFDLAERHNYRVMVIRTSRSSNECFRENIHNVPPQSIINMHGRMSELMN